MLILCCGCPPIGYPEPLSKPVVASWNYVCIFYAFCKYNDLKKLGKYNENSYKTHNLYILTICVAYLEQWNAWAYAPEVQIPHFDAFPCTEFSKCPDEKKPLSVIFSLQDDTSLEVWPGPINYFNTQHQQPKLQNKIKRHSKFSIEEK